MVGRVAMLCLHTSPLDQPGTGSSGGMNVYTRALSRALAAADIEVDLFTRSTGGLTIVADAPGVRVIAVPAGRPGPVAKGAIAPLAPACAEAIERFAASQGLRYDVVHSHYWISGLTGIQLADRWSVPLVHMFHTLSRIKTRFAGSAADPQRAHGEQRVLDAADAVVAANRIECDQLREAYRVRGTRVVTIPCGVDPSPFGAFPLRNGRHTTNVPFTIAALGRAERLKNFPLLLRAMATAGARDPRFAAAAQLRIAGGPSSDEPAVLPELQQLARTLGIADRVRFVGPVPHAQVPDFYAAADVCAVPSFYESFGLVAVEAMAAGLPVIASRVGGLQVTVDDGVNGFLVDPRMPTPWPTNCCPCGPIPRCGCPWARAA